MEKYIIDKSGQNISQFDMDYFFQYPYLVELYLSNCNLSYISPSISQCIFLEYIDISYNPMPYPPAVLFSLAKLRENPSNIIFGDEQKCTKVLAQHIIDECEYFNEVMLNFYNGTQTRFVNCPPNISTFSLFNLLFPEFSQFSDYFFLVRKYKKNVLKISLDKNLPISLYTFPQAVWSIELKYIPPNPSLRMLKFIQQYIESQSQAFNNDINYENATSFIHTISEYQDKNYIISFPENNLCFQSRRFKVFLDTCHKQVPIHILISKESAYLYIEDSDNHFYYVFDPQSISFTYIYEKNTENNILILLFGKKGISITQDSIQNIIDLISISTPIYKPNKIVNFSDQYDFKKLVNQSTLFANQVKSNFKQKNYADLDETLNQLRNIRSKYPLFSNGSLKSSRSFATRAQTFQFG